jgi:hypothetical protein
VNVAAARFPTVIGEARSGPTLVVPGLSAGTWVFFGGGVRSGQGDLAESGLHRPGERFGVGVAHGEGESPGVGVADGECRGVADRDRGSLGVRVADGIAP